MELAFENMPKMSRCQPRVRNSVAPGLARGCFEALEALILSPDRSRGGDELGFPEAKGANGTVLAHTVVLTTGLGCRELIVLIIRLLAVDLLRAHCAQFHAAAIPWASRIVSGVSVWERTLPA